MRRRPLFFKRAQRQKPPLPIDEVEIPRYPPEPPKPQKMSKLMLIAPSFTMFVMAAGMAFLYQNYIYPIIMITVGVTYFLVNIFRQREQEKRHEVERERVQFAYLNYLGEVQNELELRVEQQATYLTTIYPDAGEIASWVGDDTSRLWERAPRDNDFMVLRLGRGQVSASYSIKLPKVDIPELAPPQLLEANEMASQYQSLPDMPITTSLIDNHAITIIAPPNLREGLARAILYQIAGLHAPGDVELYAVYPSNKIDRWEWLKWLPHCQTIQTGGTVRHLGYEAESIREVYSGLLDILDESKLKRDDRTAFQVLLVADPDLIHGETILRRILDQGQSLNTALILLAPNPQEVPEGVKARITITDEQTAILRGDVGGRTQPFTPEFSTIELAESLARDLAPLQLADRQSASGLPDEIRLLDLIGSSEIEHIELESRWIEALSHPPSLLVPLGMRHGNRPLLVDLKQSGVGPHGLIAGTTGSGKSELLLTLLMSLALNHHPH